MSATEAASARPADSPTAPVADPQPAPGATPPRTPLVARAAAELVGTAALVAVVVGIVDDDGDMVPLSGVEIELELIRERGERSKELEGDTSESTDEGVAVFPDLRVDRDDENYRLRATAPDRPELGSVDSETFDIFED